MTSPKTTTPPTKTPRPSGVWIVTELVSLGHVQIDGVEKRLIGVFSSFDLADTACAGPGTFTIVNIEIEATVPATGTWKASVTICWDEVNSF